MEVGKVQVHIYSMYKATTTAVHTSTGTLLSRSKRYESSSLLSASESDMCSPMYLREKQIQMKQMTNKMITDLLHLFNDNLFYRFSKGLTFEMLLYFIMIEFLSISLPKIYYILGVETKNLDMERKNLLKTQHKILFLT